MATITRPAPARPTTPAKGRRAARRAALVAFLARVRDQLHALDDDIGADPDAFGLTDAEAERLHLGLDRAWSGLANHLPRQRADELLDLDR